MRNRQREQANLAKRHPQVFEDLKARWQAWDKQMLPISARDYSHHVSPEHQADHYAPAEGNE